MKKLIAYDLDGTLAPSKSTLPDAMGEELSELLKHKLVCVISGGKFEQFIKQLLSNLKVDPKLLSNLHIMPTCGTRYYSYDESKGEWKLNYAEDFTESEKKKIINALNKGFDELGYREKKVWGACIEDRHSQITFSALGQDIVDHLGEEGVKKKEEWDPGDKKKQEIRDFVAPLIPEFEVRVGGVTSIDVTKLGIDKAYGMQKLMDMLGLKKKEILFIGDRIREGGNDYPVKMFGIDCVEISSWQETKAVTKTINLMSSKHE